MSQILSFLLSLLVFMTFCFNVLAVPIPKCSRANNDAGRWADKHRPSNRIEWMCEHDVKSYKAAKGRMVLKNINPTDCLAAVRYAEKQQSWHGDWFLWNNITCGKMRIFIK